MSYETIEARLDSIERLIQSRLQPKPYHITLTKNTKGYGWEVSVHGDNPDEAFNLVGDIDERLRKQYGSSEG